MCYSVFRVGANAVKGSAVDHTDSTLRLRLAYSYRDRALALLKHADGSAAPERRTALHDFYAGHLQRAEKWIESILDTERRTLASLESELRATLARQDQLSAALAAGRIPPEDANRENRILTRDIQALRRRIAASRRLLQTANSDDLGGCISLPIEDYDHHIAADAEDTPQPKSSPISLAVAVAVALVVIGMGFTVFGILPNTVSVAFAVEGPPPGSTLLAVEFRNEGTVPVSLHLPWTEGVLEETPRRARLAHFGFEVSVREHGATVFRLFPNSGPCWRYLGHPLLQRSPIEVAPGLSINAALDLEQLRRTGLNADAVRLTLSRGDGKEYGHYQIVLNAPDQDKQSPR